MAWYDDVNATWRAVGRDVGAEFQFKERERMNIYEGKLVQSTEEWTVALEYIAVQEGQYDGPFKFRTTTRMKAIPNVGNSTEWEIFKEISKNKVPVGSLDQFFNTIFGDPSNNWMLPINDYTRLVSLFRIDVPKRWETKQQEWELKEENALQYKKAQIEREEVEKREAIARGIRAGQMMCDTLTSIGVDARLLEGPPEPVKNYGNDWWAGWIELAESPIRWVVFEASDEDEICVSWLVPDPLIEAGSHPIMIHPVPVKSFPIFGHIEGVTWKLREGWANQPRDAARKVAESLNKDTAVTQRLLGGAFNGLTVRSNPLLGCWEIHGQDLEDTIEVPEGRRQWECYRAIANALLAMPLPTKE